MSIIIFDTETSGLPKKRNDFSNVRMLELGYIILDDEFNIIKERNFINKIDIEVPEIITQLTGLTKEILQKEGIEQKKIFSIFLEDINNVDVLIAHNNRFDLNVLRQEFKNMGVETIYNNKIYKKINLDSLEIFRTNINKKEITNYKLQTLYKYYHTEDFIQTHRALDDCKMLHSCLKNMKNNFNPYKYYIERKYNFHKYPNHSLNDIYKKDRNYVANFIKKLPISNKIFKFLI